MKRLALFVTALFVLAVAQASAQATVDFNNFTYRVQPCGNIPTAAAVRGGRFQYDDDKMGQSFTLSVDSIVQGSLSAGTQQAVVSLSCEFPMGGAAAAYLYAVHGKTATLLGKVADGNWGGDWGGGPRSIHLSFDDDVLSVAACANDECQTTAFTKYVLRAGKLTKLSVRTVPTQNAMTRVGGIKTLGPITEYPLSSVPFSITTGPDGNLWFTEAGKIGRATPAGKIVEFAVPGVDSCDVITPGPDGNLWFTVCAAGKIGRVTPAGKITTFATPTRASGPTSIATGPDGNLWFAEGTVHKIGRVTPTGIITEFAAHNISGGNPVFMTSGPDHNLWFGEVGNIGRITMSGTIAEFALPKVDGRSHEALFIAKGPDGNLWFTEDYNSRIGKITPSGTIAHYAAPANMQFDKSDTIATGPDGNLWFTERANDKIGRVTPSGIIAEYALSDRSGPQSMTRGVDGNLWFAASGAGAIGRVTPAGKITLFPAPSHNSNPASIATGPDGNLWFIESAGGLGKMKVH